MTLGPRYVGYATVGTISTQNADAVAITGGTGTFSSLGTTPLNSAYLTGTIDIARLPALASQIQVVSSAAVSDLTTPQQTSITIGAIVTTTDGRRWIYSGSGSKTLEASYIEVADVTPDWSVVANRPANLLALASNTSGTLTLTSVTLNLAGLSSTPLNASNLSSGTVPAARIAGVAQTRVQATGTTKEHAFILSTPDGTSDGANVGSVQNLDAALFSAWRFLSHLGKEKLAVGYGNASASLGVFAGYSYFETSDATDGGSAPGFVIVQSTTYGGAVAYGLNPRFGLTADGYFIIAPRTGNGTQPLNSLPTGSILNMDHSLPVLTLGGLDVASIGYGEIRGVDINHSVVLREGQDNKISFYEYGGTLANGKGIKFYTGGLKGSQTLRLHIADDAVSVSAPFILPSYTVSGVPAAATYGRGLIYVSNETGGATLAFSDGTNWRRVQDRAVIA